MPDGRRSGRWAEWRREDSGRCRTNQLREHRSLDRAPTAVTHSFLDFVETSRGNSAHSRNTRLAVIRSSFKYVAINEPELLHHCQQVLALTSKRHEKRMIDRFSDKGSGSGYRSLLMVTACSDCVARSAYSLNSSAMG